MSKSRRAEAETLRMRASVLRRGAERMTATAGERESVQALRLKLRAAVLEFRAILKGWPR